MKATVSYRLQDLKFKISEGSDQNWSCPEFAQLAVSATDTKLGETPNVLLRKQKSIGEYPFNAKFVALKKLKSKCYLLTFCNLISIGWATLSYGSPILQYGSTDCQVFKTGIQNWKDFCLKINISEGNDWILRIAAVASCRYHIERSDLKIDVNNKCQ